jgi:bacterioferritin
MTTQATRHTSEQHSGNGSDGSFLSDNATLRKHARLNVAQGAVTSSYGADRQAVLKLLNEALATELVCMLRYRRHHFMANGAAGEAIRSELLQHSLEELGHADRIAQRIVQLGGSPDLNPQSLAEHSHAEYVEAESLAGMIKEDLVAERVAIESYTELIRFIGDSDPTTRRMLEEILAVEENHAEELASMLQPHSGSWSHA